MYLLKAKVKENIYLEDIGIIVSYNDINGVFVDDIKFESSNDTKEAIKNKKIMFCKIDGKFSEIPDKNVLDTEEDLVKVKPYENMMVIIKNYLKSRKTVMLMYFNNNWNYISLGNNSPMPMPMPPYPAERHVYAVDVILDDNHKFVTDKQIEKWDKGFSGDYNDLINKPTVVDGVVTNLANVAKTGSYNDLKDKPELSIVAKSGDYNDLVNKPDLSSIGIIRDYNDLINKPELSSVATTGNYEDLENKPKLSSVATSGDFNDLVNRPNIPTNFSTVATTGNYNDLANKPNIPILPVFAAVATTGSYNDLLGKPSLASVATTGEYEDLIHKPKIPEKSSELDLDNVYTRDEIDTKIQDSKIELYKYEAEGSNNKDCIVTATGHGVSVTKLNNNILIHNPENIQITSLQFHFLASEIGSSGRVVIDYNADAENDYNNFEMPIIQVVNDVDQSRSARLACAYNYNMSSHTVEITGLLNNANCWIKLVF